MDFRDSDNVYTLVKRCSLLRKREIKNKNLHIGIQTHIKNPRVPGSHCSWDNGDHILSNKDFSINPSVEVMEFI